MLKRILLILGLFFVLPAFSGVYEDAFNTSDKVFVYFYTSDCGYCVRFNPIFEKISEKFANNCKFVKVNVSEDYGNKLMQQFGAYYVPYVVMINSSNKTMRTIDPTCLLNYSCTKDAVDKFVK